MIQMTTFFQLYFGMCAHLPTQKPKQLSKMVEVICAKNICQCIFQFWKMEILVLYSYTNIGGSGEQNAAAMIDAHYTCSQSKHEQQLSSLKWRSQGDAMAITQPASSVL